jgi:Tol biopolymer transport system component
MVAAHGTYRYDIFTQPASGGSVTQLTTKGTTGAPQNLFPCFSPDGQQISFASGGLQWGDFDIYRMKSNASGKAVNLTAKRTGSFRIPAWRL